MEATISKVSGDWAWSLDFNAGYGQITLNFNSLQNALIVKKILEGDVLLANRDTECNTQEVVRCKDCKKYIHIIGRDEQEIYGCRYMGRTTEPNDFCSHGERKE